MWLPLQAALLLCMLVLVSHLFVLWQHTLHPNVDGGASFEMRWNIPSSLLIKEYSDTGLRTSGNIYTRNITISPLLIRHSGRYVCTVTVTRNATGNVKQAINTSAIDIRVRSNLSIYMNILYGIPVSIQLFHNNLWPYLMPVVPPLLGSPTPSLALWRQYHILWWTMVYIGPGRMVDLLNLPQSIILSSSSILWWHQMAVATAAEPL